jgi:hypothetical protein
VDGRFNDGLTILGSVLADRRTPSLGSEVDAVLDHVRERHPRSIGTSPRPVSGGDGDRSRATDGLIAFVDAFRIG